MTLHARSLPSLAILCLAVISLLSTGSLYAKQKLRIGDDIGLAFEFLQDNSTWRNFPRHYTLSIDELKTVFVPLIGKINVSNFDINALETYCQRQLIKRFPKAPPRIHVWQKSHKKIVFVHGMISRPGRITIHNSASLDKIIAAAGGFRPGAMIDSITIAPDDTRMTRSIKTKKTVDYGRYLQDPQHFKLPKIKSGEHIYIASALRQQRIFSAAEGPRRSLNRQRINVLGAVQKPGYITYTAEMQLGDVLAQVGGLHPSNDNRLIIRHQTASDPERIDNLVDNDASLQFSPGDTLVFPYRPQETFLDKINKIGGLFSVFVSALSLLLLAL